MSIAYRGYTIVASAARSKLHKNFIPVTHISWKIGEKTGSQAIVSRVRFSTAEAASDYALATAKAWIDRRAAGKDEV